MTETIQVLIIDDDESHLRMLKTVLEKAGYQVLTASDGLQGFEQFSQHRCDLVICDIFMPEQEGLETITEIKEKRPETKIIAISGGGARAKYVAEDILTIARDLGADQVMSKPIDIPRLLTTIKAMTT